MHFAINLKQNSAFSRGWVCISSGGLGRHTPHTADTTLSQPPSLRILCHPFLIFPRIPYQRMASSNLWSQFPKRPFQICKTSFRPISYLPTHLPTFILFLLNSHWYGQTCGCLNIRPTLRYFQQTNVTSQFCTKFVIPQCWFTRIKGFKYILNEVIPLWEAIHPRRKWELHRGRSPFTTARRRRQPPHR